MTDRSTERTTPGARSGDGVEPTLAGEVLGHGLFRMAPRDLAALRRRPGPVPEGWSRVPPSLLRYADEQTVVATAAVFSALGTLGVPPEGFADWGVVVASRYLGRANLAAALRSFQAEGVWGTSPHLIPHFALHSPSGTISLALGLHGPNLGVGGGLHAAAEGFLVALTWLAAGRVPGVWLVFTGWSPELVPDRRGQPPTGGECQALALALVALAAGAAASRPAFRVRSSRSANSPSGAAPIDLVGLAGSLEARGHPAPRTIATDPRGRLRVELVEGSEGPG